MDKSISTSILHTAVGLLVGTAIDFTLHAPDASSSTGMLAFEAAVAVGLNGVALALLGPLIAADDKTYGIPFSVALLTAQPGLQHRLEVLSIELRAQALGLGQRTRSLVAKEDIPNQ
jgi:hypothetical protein